ncbi:alginate lyase [Rhizobium sp. Root274]|uniref:alginate lyase family protein n=1 Tax=unclassified Rhizobium TaxID=2613769 RepID=UPI0007144FE1|nr:MULTISPECIES: alginate lyase family protein [unclassified Rhizobium]KQW29598.1 alginate lyase [Rhizobium sp. Root1240]KRD29790.1 alginate lyase [Rhizobium sp. Root274]
MTYCNRTRLALIATTSLLFVGTAIGGASTAEAAQQTCFTAPKPVMSLGFGSRYEAASKSRSDLDEESDAKVTKALKPIDEFIQDLAKQISKAGSEKDVATRRLYQRCVVENVYTWAKADALNDMRTPNAKLSIPSRVGGIAIAYAEARNQVPGLGDKQRTIEAWLLKRARETVYFFDNEATKGASRNNLRAWASLGVGEVGILTEDRALVDWAIMSNKTMIEGASPDGSIPLEMNRMQYALHYQLHAMTPLVASVARLCDAGYGKGGADFGKLGSMARFSVNAVKDPKIVQKINGKAQTVKPGLKTNASSLAWLEPYVALSNDVNLEKEFASLRPLSNSKLGGNQTALYDGRRISCTITAQN